MKELKKITQKVVKIKDLILLNRLVLVVPISNPSSALSSGENGIKLEIAKGASEEDEKQTSSYEIEFGKVIRVSPDLEDIIKIGDIVFFGRYGGRDLDINGVATRMLFYSDIQGIADVELSEEN